MINSLSRECMDMEQPESSVVQDPDGYYQQNASSNRQRRPKVDGISPSAAKVPERLLLPLNKKQATQSITWITILSRLYDLAWPLSGMEILAFAKELIITAYVGHLGAFELSSLVLALTVYNVTGTAPMLGIVVAMETFCGQAYGAKQWAMVGIVMQRALIITTIWSCCCIAFWGQSEWLLLQLGQDPLLAKTAGRFTMLLAPCLVMDGAEQCMRRYLSAQSVVQPQMVLTFIATILTPVYLWLFIIRCKYGLDGAAMAWCCVQATSLVGMFLYVYCYNLTQEPTRVTWTGWSVQCLQEWGVYIKVAVPSMIMMCLDWWTFEMLVILSGLLPKPDLTMSMMGITFNIHALCFFAAHGLSGAASTRVGNELGAGRPQVAWQYTQASVAVSTTCMLLAACVLMYFREFWGGLFTMDADVMELTSQAVPAIALSLIGEGGNTVIAGVLRGTGRQRIGATVNLCMYWGLGLPFSYMLAFRMGLGAMGLWMGLACTSSMQALYLVMVVFRFDWNAEAIRAKALIQAGEVDFDVDDELLQELSAVEDDDRVIHKVAS